MTLTYSQTNEEELRRELTLNICSLAMVKQWWFQPRNLPSRDEALSAGKYAAEPPILTFKARYWLLNLIDSAFGASTTLSLKVWGINYGFMGWVSLSWQALSSMSRQDRHGLGITLYSEILLSLWDIDTD